MANFVYLAVVYFLSQMYPFLSTFHADDSAADLAASSSKVEYIQNSTEVFDYIVVGSGSAGAVVANRLSASGLFSVLVLERGGAPSPLTAVPSLWLPLAYDPDSVARYPTVPQSHMLNRVYNPPAGKVLGGGSTLNAMNYIRGSPALFDEWASITGDPRWSWDGVLPYFRKLEDYHGVFSDPVDLRYHGEGGPIHIEAANLVQPSNNLFFAAAAEKGLHVHDLNANLSVGVQPSDLNIKNGKRWGTYEGYLQPVLDRPNLSVYPYSTATKIQFEKTLLGGRKAVGVTYTRHGATRYAKARREVIVSAGIFETTRLLLLSGVGPKDDLAALGIPSVANLPVGKTFMDHLSITVNFLMGQGTTFVPERDMTTETEVEYLRTGYGPIHNDLATYGFITSSQNPDPNYPDLQFFVNHQTAPGTDPVAAQNIVRADTNQVSLYLNRPKSVGSIGLTSADPTAPLRVDPNYGSDPSDLPRLIDGLKFLVDLYETSSTYAGAGGASLIDSAFPATCRALPYRSDAYWTCVLQTTTAGGIHFAGPSRMGKSFGDPNAVVDSQLRVLGVSGLRVADASVMPRVTNANTATATMMIGERASDFILWGL